MLAADNPEQLLHTIRVIRNEQRFKRALGFQDELTSQICIQELASSLRLENNQLAKFRERNNKQLSLLVRRVVEDKGLPFREMYFLLFHSLFTSKHIPPHLNPKAMIRNPECFLQGMIVCNLKEGRDAADDEAKQHKSN